MVDVADDIGGQAPWDTPLAGVGSTVAVRGRHAAGQHIGAEQAVGEEAFAAMPEAEQHQHAEAEPLRIVPLQRARRNKDSRSSKEERRVRIAGKSS